MSQIRVQSDVPTSTFAETKVPSIPKKKLGFLTMMAICMGASSFKVQ